MNLRFVYISTIAKTIIFAFEAFPIVENQIDTNIVEILSISLDFIITNTSIRFEFYTRLSTSFRANRKS